MSLIERPPPSCSPSRRKGEATAEAIADAFLAADPRPRAEGQGVPARRRGRRPPAGRGPSTRSARRGEPLGALAGVPVAVKDVLCTKGVPTTCGSKILENFVPPYDAHVVERLQGRRRGPDRQDEHGRVRDGLVHREQRLPGHAQPVGPRAHPRRLVAAARAAAVAACQAPLALGTDTGGSIRQPAGLCGVVGLKPTYGRVSPLRPGRLRQLARPGRPVRPRRRRRRPAARSHRRPRPRATAPASTGPVPAYTQDARTSRSRPLTHRRAAGVLRRGARRRGRGGRPGGAEGVREARGDAEGGVAAAQPVRPGGVLPRGHGRGVEQPGPLRRHALRPPHRRRRPT